MKNNRFYMPAEWAEHERTLIEWPIKDSMVWPGNYEIVCEDYAKIAKAISEFEAVTMIVSEGTAKYAQKLCGNDIDYLTIDHNDAWCRDNGPTFVLDGDNRISAINWKFNAWGGKYTPFDLDDEVAPKVLKYYGVPCIDSHIVLEGGSIHVDGEGTLLTTRECLLNKNRNPHLSEQEIEEELRERLGIEKIIWLNHGLFGDETDGHIDNLACFAKPGSILIQVCNETSDPNYEITQESLKILKDAKDGKGRRLEIIEIPQPPARYYQRKRLTLSYLNFYMVNGGIILPVFGGDAENADQKAIEVLANTFPNRKIVPIETGVLISEGGNIHCITQQFPKGIR